MGLFDFRGSTARRSGIGRRYLILSRFTNPSLPQTARKAGSIGTTTIKGRARLDREPAVIGNGASKDAPDPHKRDLPDLGRTNDTDAQSYNRNASVIRVLTRDYWFPSRLTSSGVPLKCLPVRSRARHRRCLGKYIGPAKEYPANRLPEIPAFRP